MPQKIVKKVIENKAKFFAVFLLFLVHVFLRFYQLESRFSLGYDQLDSAWAAKRIIVDHNFPLLGPANKLSSGIFIGPLYYYLISIFYFFTNLDPIAAALFAGITSIFSFFVLFFITKKLFSFNTAFLAVFINTISFSGIYFDRIQWEINFIPAVALIGFYALYRIVNGEEKYLMLLALALGLAFNVHLTVAVFMSVITILLMPFFPKTKKTIQYCLVSLAILLIFFSPLIIANFQTKSALSENVFQYFKESFHGFHLTRVSQLKHSAMIQIESFFTFSWLRPLNLIILPLFLIIYYLRQPFRKTFTFIYLTALWFIIPWFVLATYKGEITDYYFSSNRFMAIFIIAYLTTEFLKTKKILITLLIVIFGIYYSINNLQRFFSVKPTGLSAVKASIRQTIQQEKVIPYKEASPDSYLYYIYTRKK